jgi:integrase
MNTRKGGTRDGLFQRRSWWYLDWYDAAGKRHRKKAAPDYATAKLMYRDLMGKLAKGEVTGIREEGMRLRDFIDQRYWPAIAATLSPEWAERSRDILDRLIQPTFGTTKLSGLRREAIEQWLAQRRATVSSSTANKELARLKHLLTRAVAWGYLRESPAAAVKRGSEAPGRVRYLSPEERTQLLEGGVQRVTSTDGRTWALARPPSPTLKLYMIAALQTGGRRSDLIRLRWRDVDLHAGTISFVKTKNRERRIVPITATLRRLLLSLPRPLSGDAPVFPVVAPRVLTRMFRRYVDALGLENLTLHSLRHDVGSVLTVAGTPQRAIMAILGHKDPRMTVRYQHLAPGHLRDAMRALDQATTTEHRTRDAKGSRPMTHEAEEVRTLLVQHLETLAAARRALPEDDPQREEALALEFKLAEAIDRFDRSLAVRATLEGRVVPPR